MLGSFLELGVATTQIQESFAFYQRLGFDAAIAGDVLAHPYGVLVDAALALGLHARLEPSPALTFVKPGVAQLARELEQRGIELTLQRLGADSFNELGFDDAAGLAVRVLEARTYSPPSPAAPAARPLGLFDFLSVPARDPDGAAAFWRDLGYPVWDQEDDDWSACSVAFGRLRLAFHRRALLAEPLLLFRTASLQASRAGLADLGIEARAAGVRGLGARHAVIEAPEGSLLLLRELPGR
jgi:hypothetical protein